MELIFTLFFIAVISNLLAFDAVLRKEMKDHPDQWKADGYPWGYVFFTRRSSFLEGIRARAQVRKSWRSTNPSWAVSDKMAILCLQVFRSSSYAAFAFWILAVLKMMKVI